MLGWVESYLMRDHPDLGRTGAVCPFTRQAAKIDTVRLAISSADAANEEEAFALIRRAFSELEKIPCKAGMKHFRTVIVGFPNCSDDEGVAMLQRVQARHKFYSLSRFRMIGFMHAGNEAPGLWNPAFRPLRAPLPVLAIRHLVEQDAPFAARHPLLLAPFLIKFRFDGAKRILAYWRAQKT
ncbi:MULTISPECIES: DUF6875 domain-containing protein [Phyllobacteriaceae]|uniref:DUF6875 domain-containing protein n=1 Tax=Phyllobacteriaceae TaxID=69277 RepID=UPI0010F7B7EF|nr:MULTISPECIES: hypothetical protein [Mesorhizobium]MBN9234253.1 hypothetical protein [Mesorhizobium sp.]MDQ0332318.1 hypothetical protein [Mesorhizobium sp. YL-MeA3-2017]